MRVGKRAPLVLVAMVLVVSADVSAHRLDEFLQAARIAVERDRISVEMTLTPGVAVADGVIREIDGDRDGSLSESERRSYISGVLNAIDLRVDDSTALQLASISARFPDIGAIRSGEGAIQLQAETRLQSLPAGPHRVFFSNHHGAGNSAYLANALIPDDDDVAVTEQRRDGTQSELTIEFLVQDVRRSSRPWLWTSVAGVLMLVWPIRYATLKRRATSEAREGDAEASLPQDSATRR